jgi:hypothetical protein
MPQNMKACQKITNNPCAHINAELLLVPRMDYIMKILLCPLVLVVNIDDAVSTETCLICNEHWWNKEMLSTQLNRTMTKFSRTGKSALIHK